MTNHGDIVLGKFTEVGQGNLLRFEIVPAIKSGGRLENGQQAWVSRGDQLHPPVLREQVPAGGPPLSHGVFEIISISPDKPVARNEQTDLRIAGVVAGNRRVKQSGENVRHPRPIDDTHEVVILFEKIIPLRRLR